MRIPRDQIYDTTGLEPLFPMAANMNYVHSYYMSHILFFVSKSLRNLEKKTEN